MMESFVSLLVDVTLGGLGTVSYKGE
jgi:hypothetical protein